MTEIRRYSDSVALQPAETAGFGHLAEVLALVDIVVDVACKECGKHLEGVDVLTVVHSRPCPLCADCAGCRAGCLTGLISHGVTPEFFTELREQFPTPTIRAASAPAELE